MIRVKFPLSRSSGGLPRRLLGAVALAAVLVMPTGTVFAGQAAAAQAPAAAKTTLKVVVIGDSYTSGEGADSSTYKQVPVVKTGQDGVPYQVLEVDPAHQSSTAPTLQALNQIQAANPNVDLQVTFVPVSGATRTSLYQTTQPGTPFEQPPQINAVKDADIVIVGIGGNDAGFTNWINTVLWSTESTSTQTFPQYMQQFNNGSYLNDQVTLLNNISKDAAPNATIISLGYPKAMPAEIPNSSAFLNPVSWSLISQGEANMSNQLATTLSMNNQDASFIAAGQHPDQQFLYADVSDALQGHELFTSQPGLNGVTPSNPNGSYHPNDLGQQLLGSVVQPYVEQAVNDQLGRLGIQGAQNVPVITPTFASQWNLRVQMPLQMQQLSQQAPPAPPPDQVPAQLPPAQDWPKPTDQPADQTTKPDDQPAKPADQPDASKPAPADSAPAKPDNQPAQPDGSQSGAAQPDASQQGAAQPNAAPSSGAQPDASQSGAAPPNTGQPGAAQPDASTQPDATQPSSSAATPADGTQAPAAGAPGATPATPSTDASGATPAAPADTSGATPAAPSADTPAATPAAPSANTPAAPADTPAAPASADTPAAPAADTPAAAPPADAAATPPAAATPAPAAPAPVDTPAAAPAPPAVQPAPAPPVAPAPVIIDPAPVIPAPPPVVAPPPPVITPVTPPDDSGVPNGDTGVTGDSSDPGLTGGIEPGLDTGGGGIDAGLTGDSGGDSGGGDG